MEERLKKIEIVYKRVEEVTPYDKNPRNNDKAVDKVAESIKEFGFKVPIVLDKNGVIITGHTRLKAAKKLGLAEVPTIQADDLSDAQVKAFRLADNKVSEFAEWNIDLLNKEITALLETEDYEFKKDELGFSEYDININDVSEDDTYLKNYLEKSYKQQAEDIEKEDKEAKEKIKQGDIFKLGSHYLMCGDSTNKEHIDKLINNRTVKLLLTDPPYGIGVVRNVDNGTIPTTDKKTDTSESITKTAGTVSPVNVTPAQRKKLEAFKTKHGLKDMKSAENTDSVNITVNRVYKTVEGDADTNIFKKCWNVIKDYKFDKCIWGGNYFLDFLPFSKNFIIWKKKPDNKQRNNFCDGEIAWCSFEAKCNIYTYPEVKVLDVFWNGINKYKGWGEFEDKYARFHPTQKPVKLSAEVLLKFTDVNDWTLDLFGGSGSSLIAAEKTKRKMLMMEYDPYYVKKIIERWEALTGKKATKLGEEGEAEQHV